MQYAFINYFRNPFPFMRSVWVGLKKMFTVFNILAYYNAIEMCSNTKIHSKFAPDGTKCYK